MLARPALTRAVSTTQGQTAITLPSHSQALTLRHYYIKIRAGSVAGLLPDSVLSPDRVVLPQTAGPAHHGLLGGGVDLENILEIFG